MNPKLRQKIFIPLAVVLFLVAIGLGWAAIWTDDPTLSDKLANSGLFMVVPVLATVCAAVPWENS